MYSQKVGIHYSNLTVPVRNCPGFLQPTLALHINCSNITGTAQGVGGAIKTTVKKAMLQKNVKTSAQIINRDSIENDLLQLISDKISSSGQIIGSYQYVLARVQASNVFYVFVLCTSKYIFTGKGLKMYS